MLSLNFKGSIQKSTHWRELVIILMMWGVIFLPFTKGLTVDIGFPLKVYEMLFPAAIFIFIVSGQLRMTRFYRVIIVLVGAFAFFGAMSISVSDKYATSALDITYRGGKTFDGLLRIIYFLFNCATLVVVTSVVSERPKSLLWYWGLGLRIAVAYHIYCFAAITVGLSPFLLPGLERHQMGELAGFGVPRSGTFEEGNFAGLYYLCSLVISVHSNKLQDIFISIIGILLTLSTSVFISAGLFLFVYTYLRYGFSIIGFLQFLIITAFSLLLYGNVDFTSKFGQDAGSSAYVRLNESLTGLNIFVANPVLGVGIGGYGYHFKHFEWDPLLSAFSDAQKPIPNNVYVEILSENGLIGILILVLLSRLWFQHMQRGGRCLSAFFSGGCAMAAGFLAYPTYNVTYIWVFFGMSFGLALNERNRIDGL